MLIVIVAVTVSFSVTDSKDRPQIDQFQALFSYGKTRRKNTSRMKYIQHIERTEHMERIELIERIERTERIQHIELIERVERTEHIQHTERRERRERIALIERIERTERICSTRCGSRAV